MSNQIDTSAEAVERLARFIHTQCACALGANAEQPVAGTIRALAAERDRLAAQLDKAEADCAMFAAANARQAMCISFTAANLGPEEYSATVEGLPKAARHVAAENARLRDALRKISTAAPRIDIDPLDFLREFVRPTARAALKGDSHE